jgi:hypothetical protein
MENVTLHTSSINRYSSAFVQKQCLAAGRLVSTDAALDACGKATATAVTQRKRMAQSGPSKWRLPPRALHMSTTRCCTRLERKTRGMLVYLAYAFPQSAAVNPSAGHQGTKRHERHSQSFCLVCILGVIGSDRRKRQKPHQHCCLGHLCTWHITNFSPLQITFWPRNKNGISVSSKVRA